MKALPTQDRALRKRDALLKAAVTEFSTVGFDIATAKSIASAAGVATGTFYQYFENKNDILCVIAIERFKQLHEQIQMLSLTEISFGEVSSADFNMNGLIDLFERTLAFVYQFHADNPELHQVLEHRRGIDPSLHKIMSEGESVLESRVLLFVQSQNIEHANIVADNLFAMAEGLIHRHVFHHMETNIEQTIKIGARMLASYFLPVSNHHT